MRTLMRVLPAWPVLLTALLFGGQRLEAQTVAWKRQAIASVMHYRAVVLADTATRFDRCRVEEHAGAAASALRPHIAEFFERMLAPCHSPGASPNRHAVGVRSVTRNGGDVTVEVQVTHGEWVHHEVFTLRSRGDPLMGVREVRMTGGVQFHYVDPTRPKPAATPPGSRR